MWYLWTIGAISSRCLGGQQPASWRCLGCPKAESVERESSALKLHVFFFPLTFFLDFVSHYSVINALDTSMHSDITTPWCHWLKVHSYITTQGSTKPLQGWSWWTDSAEVQRDFESCGLALGSVDSLVSSIYFCRFFADFWGLSQFHDGGINLKRYCQHFRTLCVLAYISFSIRAWHSTVCHAILWPDFLQLQEKLGTNCRWDWPTLIRGEVLPFESCP